jgi:hypothetical protein
MALHTTYVPVYVFEAPETFPEGQRNVRPGEHPYVRRESVIAYKFGELLPPRYIERLKSLAPRDHRPVTPELLRRIQGALDSPDAIPRLRKSFEQFSSLLRDLGLLAERIELERNAD